MYSVQNWCLSNTVISLFLFILLSSRIQQSLFEKKISVAFIFLQRNLIKGRFFLSFKQKRCEKTKETNFFFKKKRLLQINFVNFVRGIFHSIFRLVTPLYLYGQLFSWPLMISLNLLPGYSRLFSSLLETLLIFVFFFLLIWYEYV